MLKRVVEANAFSSVWGRQMRFIVGPRQCGKTTMAKSFLSAQACDAFYYNWDSLSLQRRLRKDPQFFYSDLTLAPNHPTPAWVCFDEFHKQFRWKNLLKGWFDQFEKEIRFIVTGSAMLSVKKKADDSLAGRFMPFHVYPLRLSEIVTSSKSSATHIPVTSKASDWLKTHLPQTAFQQEAMESLLRCSGFPEPFLQQSEAFLIRWSDTYLEVVLKQDLRDLAHIQDVSNLATLVSILPETIGSPLSINSLRNDLQGVHYSTVKNYFSALLMGFVLFEIPVYAEKIRRSLRKEKKVYFFDWTRIPEAPARFENYVACEWLSRIQEWNDQGAGPFNLRYLRQTTGHETDFLILYKNKPWLMCEVKMSDQPIASHHHLFARQLGGIPIVQVCHEPNVAIISPEGPIRISASRFFSI